MLCSPRTSIRIISSIPSGHAHSNNSIPSSAKYVRDNNNAHNREIKKNTHFNGKPIDIKEWDARTIWTVYYVFWPSILLSSECKRETYTWCSIAHRYLWAFQHILFKYTYDFLIPSRLCYEVFGYKCITLQKITKHHTDRTHCGNVAEISTLERNWLITCECASNHSTRKICRRTTKASPKLGALYFGLRKLAFGEIVHDFFGICFILVF